MTPCTAPLPLDAAPPHALMTDDAFADTLADLAALVATYALVDRSDEALRWDASLEILPHLTRFGFEEVKSGGSRLVALHPTLPWVLKITGGPWADAGDAQEQAAFAALAAAGLHAHLPHTIPIRPRLVWQERLTYAPERVTTRLLRAIRRTLASAGVQDTDLCPQNIGFRGETWVWLDANYATVISAAQRAA